MTGYKCSRQTANPLILYFDLQRAAALYDRSEEAASGFARGRVLGEVYEASNTRGPTPKYGPWRG